MTLYEQRKCRQRRANALLRVIARNGRRFFCNRQRNTVSYFVIDERGRLWWSNSHNGQRVYLHQSDSAEFRGFTEGGTLRALMLALKRYIWTGTPIHPGHFGPWPAWICEGDLWGYGDSMKWVRRAARRLSIVTD